jgi:outer membrane protein
MIFAHSTSDLLLEQSMKLGVAGILGGVAVVLLAGAATPAAAQTPRKAAPAPSAAAAPATGRLAYVDQRKIFAEAPGYSQAESTFTREIEGYRAEVQRMQAQFDSAGSKFEQESVVLSPTQKQQRSKELQDLREKLEARTQELQQKAATRERELLAPIQQKVYSVITALRDEGKYAMIFDVSAQGSGVLTADPSLDITQQVIDRLKNAK